MKSILPNKLSPYDAILYSIKELKKHQLELKQNYIIMKQSYFNLEVGQSVPRIDFVKESGIVASIIGIPCYIAADIYFNEVIGEATNFIATSDKDYFDKIVLLLKAKMWEDKNNGK